MKRRHHLRLFGLATLIWAGFLVAGLPDYYQQYSTGFMVAFDAILLLPITVILWRVLSRVSPARRMRFALWIAFYFTVPLAVYDFVVCGLVLGSGLGFLVDYWYLTVYYGIPWILAPAVARQITRHEVVSSEKANN